MATGKTIALTRQIFVGKVMSLLFNMPSRLVITFLPRSKHLLISWLQSPFPVILEPKKIKSDTISTVFPSNSHEVMGPDAMILVFWMLSFKPTFSLSSFTFIKRLFSSSSLSAIRVVLSAYMGYWYFSRQFSALQTFFNCNWSVPGTTRIDKYFKYHLTINLSHTFSSFQCLCIYFLCNLNLISFVPILTATLCCTLWVRSSITSSVKSTFHKKDLFSCFIFLFSI